ncbi:MAG: rRNA adenine N-6-methyltransferase family protein [Butyricicoccaceae bacterium]
MPRRIAEMSGARRVPATSIEVGPGMGCLSAELCRRADKVVAVELDRALAAGSGRDHWRSYDNFEVVRGDVLAKLDLAALCTREIR